MTGDDPRLEFPKRTLEMEATFAAAEGAAKHLKKFIQEICRAVKCKPEPFAWYAELATVRSVDGVYGGWEGRLSMAPFNAPEGSVRNLIPLYTEADSPLSTRHREGET